MLRVDNLIGHWDIKQTYCHFGCWSTHVRADDRTEGIFMSLLYEYNLADTGAQVSLLLLLKMYVKYTNVVLGDIAMEIYHAYVYIYHIDTHIQES